MKFPWTLLAAMLFSMSVAAKSATYTLDSSPFIDSYNWTVTEEEDVKDRLQKINLPFELQYNSEVSFYINRYTTSGYRDAQAILGRTALYFPIFEHFLDLYQLPEELKFLPMVESNLRPTVKSPVGAVGLWQFMPSTATRYDLSITESFDGRQDPYQSTEAAVKMLAELYGQFGDWALVLAAYNCGPGRVRKAIRYAGCDDFWEIRKYLPKQTQKYIPAFIAMAYLVNYYGEHEMSPKYPDYNLMDTRAFVVNDYFRFTDISKACGLDYGTISYLNPGYQKGYVPKNSKGNVIVLPATSVAAFKAYLAERKGAVTAPENSFVSSYTVLPGDEIETLAMLFSCDPLDIMAWNYLDGESVVVNQELTLFLPLDENAIRP